MNAFVEADRPSILSYLHDPDLPPELVETFFRAALDYADARPWARLQPAAQFPILLEFAEPEPGARRLAMILGGEGSGGDALGLVLVEDLPGEEDGMAHPALTVLYAGYPEPDMAPIRWRGRPLPRSRAGLLPWPTVHDVDDRVRAPRRAELGMLTCGLLGVLRLLSDYPSPRLCDSDLHPHGCELQVDGLSRICTENYAESVQERKIAARIILTWPLWGWFTVPLAAIGCFVWLGGVVFGGSRSLWRAAFPGKSPSDGPGPSQGAYR
jgi:hypothetical protein